MLTLRRDGHADLMNRFRDEFGRLFGRAVAPHSRTGVLSVNIWEDENALYAELDLPGFTLDKIDVQVTDGDTLTISAERAAPEVQNAVWYRQERGHGQVARTLTLPVLVDADNVEARYELGVLRLTLPKSPAAKPRRITVKTD